MDDDLQYDMTGKKGAPFFPPHSMSIISFFIDMVFASTSTPPFNPFLFQKKLCPLLPHLDIPSSFGEG